MSVNTGTILVFCPDRPVWLTKLRGALIPLGVRVRFVAQEELSQSVGCLALILSTPHRRLLLKNLYWFYAIFQVLH